MADAIHGSIKRTSSMYGSVAAGSTVEILNKGLETETAKTNINQTDKSISVDVKKVPHTLTVQHDGKEQVFDGSESVVINIDDAADLHYTYKQNLAAKVWNVNHNLGKYPSVTSVEDRYGTNLIGEVKYIDENNLQITFSIPIAGIAYLN